MKQNIKQFHKQTKKQSISNKLYLSNKLTKHTNFPAMNSQQINLQQNSLYHKQSLCNDLSKISLSAIPTSKSLSPEQNTGFYIALEGMCNWRQLCLDGRGQLSN